MKSNRFWLVLFAALLGLSALGGAYVLGQSPKGAVARVYHHGRLIHTLALDGDFAPYTLTVTGDVDSIIAVEPGRVCVQAATCPDGLCVRQGWLSGGLIPVVCLPGGLVIEIEGGAAPAPDALLP